METKIKKYMEKMGYNSIADFKGLGLKYIVPQGKARWLIVHPAIDEKRCNGCGLCTKMGHCEAYSLENEKPLWIWTNASAASTARQYAGGMR